MLRPSSFSTHLMRGRSALRNMDIIAGALKGISIHWLNMSMHSGSAGTDEGAGWSPFGNMDRMFRNPSNALNSGCCNV